MVTSVSTSNSSSITSMQDFIDGKVNLSKDDLTESVKSAIADGETPSSMVVDIIDSYDKIDTNGDGISYDELTTYKKSGAGIASSMGLSASSLKQQEISLVTEAFLGDDSDSSGTDLYSLLSSSSVSKSTTDAINSYLSTLTSSTESTDKITDTSIIDLLS